MLEDSLVLTPIDLDVEFGDDLSYRRGGVQDAVMRRLRRGYYRVEAELDLHGLIVAEAKRELRDFLSRCIARQQRCVRVIHGKGTGALRSRVGEMLKKDTRVAGFRLGAWNEGGAGVTVAEFT